MVGFKISGNGSELHVGIDQLGGKQSDVLRALQECAEGRCTCPTPQYGKLDSVTIVPGAGRIAIALKARPGETIDRQAIDKCLEHTAHRLNLTLPQGHEPPES